MSKHSKKSFAIIAIIVGVIGVAIGAYIIVTVGSTLGQTEEGEWTLRNTEGLHPLSLNGSPLLGSPDADVGELG